ncbi:hypothetical protein [Alkalihalobacillus sp. CinArs1]|uniref:hypothetical protein n=1 Tax=Alkalihalobacillus sp. CinArs1 TaxID=2995314 RepID=UPI0022DDAD31|nr:hypothetical protein [Alkalihalobacillus sp. CinArs1]
MKRVQLFSTFENHSYLEIAISNLEKQGIPREKIYAVPLDKRAETKKLFDTLHSSDGISLIDIGLPLATAFSVITASIGFELAWGPIYWGLIGAGAGFVLGVIIRLIIFWQTEKGQKRVRRKQADLILIVECEASISEKVEKILWEHFAMGLAKVESGT